MTFTTALSILILTHLSSLCSADPKPQFFPLFHGPPPPPHNHFLPPGIVASSAPNFSEPWRRTTPQNLSNPLPATNDGTIDPLSSTSAEDILKNHIPRQIYGFPPPTSGGYPQIYKIDNLIIIANPVQPQPQPCPPQRPQTGGTVDDGSDVLNRIPGDMPSPCTWAIVACCSPGSESIRYNCFDLFGCQGQFVGSRLPCSPRVVQQAAKSALDYYSNANNSTSNNPNTNFNRI